MVNPGKGARTLRVRHAFTHRKRDGEPNEDRWGASQDGLICAVSDGASISYDPGPWAEILVARFAAHQRISAEWIDEAMRSYLQRYDREEMSWSQQGAFDRGSFATLVGVACKSDGATADIWSCGDSIVVLTVGGQLEETFPYSDPSEFDQSPRLLSTSSSENRWLDEDEIKSRWRTWELPRDGLVQVLLMTDALGRWLLEDPSLDRISVLVDMADEQRFAEFVKLERAAGRLRKDDTTLVVMERGL